MSDTIILIPARMASTRLPGKPLADIRGMPMIVHVVRRAAGGRDRRGGGGDRFGSGAAAVEKAGGRAVMTRADHPSGSDRIYEALAELDPERRIKIVVNVQGDLPTIAPADITAALSRSTTPRSTSRPSPPRSSDEAERTNPNVVKVIGRAIAPRRLHAHNLHPRQCARGRGPALSSHRALRLSPRRAGDIRQLPPSANEKREKLEQLRALDAGMRIDVAIVDGVPLGVDTPEDLEKARGMLRR